MIVVKLMTSNDDIAISFGVGKKNIFFHQGTQQIAMSVGEAEVWCLEVLMLLGYPSEKIIPLALEHNVISDAKKGED